MIQSIILNLLHNLGGQREVDRYIREYASPGASKTAVVKVGGALIMDDIESLASSLAFLKHVGMSPIVIHGAGPQISLELESLRIQSDWIDGMRVTPPDVLAAAHRVFVSVGQDLTRAIDQHGVRARFISTGIFQAARNDDDRLGFVGRVTKVNQDHIDSALNAGYIPIISPLGLDKHGQLLNINADTATRAVCETLKPGKILFLTSTGGIMDASGDVISAINLNDDFDRLIQSGAVSGGMARKIIEIQELLNGLSPNTSVSISSPSQLARELFTHKGSGTLIRQGVTIQVHDSLCRLDLPELRHLIEQSFGRTLAPNYLDTVFNAEALIVPYTATAIVRKETFGSYLDKFAVTAKAQGEGVGASLWKKLIERHPKLFWRSRIGNPINAWYMNQADGMERCENWLIFWRGFHSHEQIQNLVHYAKSVNSSFVEYVNPEVQELVS